jgi:hypothetical protein
MRKVNGLKIDLYTDFLTPKKTVKLSLSIVKEQYNNFKSHSKRI